MEDKYYFITISGSLRKKSFNTMVVKAAQKLAPACIFIEQISVAEMSMYNFDLHETFYPECVENLCTDIKAADAVIIVTPEYNYSIPGVLKNVIDVLSKHTLKTFDRKALGIINASPV
jgi:chromate reductase